jgi:hypothetical protein
LLWNATPKRNGGAARWRNKAPQKIAKTDFEQEVTEVTKKREVVAVERYAEEK